MRLTVPVLLFSLCLPLAAQTPALVKDINTSYAADTESSSPTGYVAYRGRTYFSATLDASGTELWSTDGTAAGTSMLLDIIPGSESSAAIGLAVVNDRLIFRARSLDAGVELWVSDGTREGTRLLADIDGGTNSSQPGMGVVYKNRVLFSANQVLTGRELWITDGTASGTRMLKDLDPGVTSASPAHFVTMGDTVYFLAAGALWKTDGTEAGTVKVVATGSVRNLAVAGTQLFFERATTGTGWELWISDGTEAGTRLVMDILPGNRGAFESNYSAQGFTAFGDRVLFLANDGVHGRELWISDGSTGGTRMLRDFLPGEKGNWDSRFANLAVFGERVFFDGRDDGRGEELWETDGTEAGTKLFADLAPGTPSSSPWALRVSGGKLFFGAYTTDRRFGAHLWVSDGSVSGTRPLGNGGFTYDGGSTTPIDGKLHFTGWTNLTGGEPWVSDGTDAGTRLIANLAPEAAPSSIPRQLTATDQLLFFHATEGTRSPSGSIDSSLWRSDGTAAGTFKLRETGQHPTALIPGGPFVFYRHDKDTSILMMSDGTSEGTKPADEFMARFNGSWVKAFYPLNDAFLVTVNESYGDTSLWKTTAAHGASATKLGTLNPFSLTPYANGYAFFARDPLNHSAYGLWETDGTTTGTRPIVRDLGVRSTRDLGHLANAAGTLFFLKKRSGEPTKLWKSDGTTRGTVMVKEVPLSSDIYGTQAAAAGARVFFASRDSLWTSDGSDSGTIELATVNLSFSDDLNDVLRVVGNRIVFAQGYELWTSDGTKPGTRRLAAMGPYSSSGIALLDGMAYFAGTDDLRGAEPWISDGTVEGTMILADVNPGPASSSPDEFVKAGEILYFRGYHDATGDELWALPLRSPIVSIADARAVEGDSTENVMRFTVSHKPSPERAVSIDYATSDGTARVNEDYDAASGTLVFEPGETAKTIEVPLRGDLTFENNETFHVTLGKAAGARVVKRQGTGMIEDDDDFADLGIATSFIGSSAIRDSVTVANSGPRNATDVIVRVTSLPHYARAECMACSFAEIATGESKSTPPDHALLADQVYLSAIASSRERDPRATNNSTSWTVGPYRTMAMDAAYLTPGTTATITADVFGQTPAIYSSDPAVVSVSSGLTKVSERLSTFTVTALKEGSSRIRIDGDAAELTVNVVAAGTTPRWPGALTVTPEFTSISFHIPQNVTITPSLAPVSGATATGTIIVTAEGRELARHVLTGAEPVEIPFYLPTVGTVPYQIQYSGDANFHPQTVDRSVTVTRGQVTITGGLRKSGTTGTYSVRVEVEGSPMAAPTGEVVFFHGTNQVAQATLVPLEGGRSFAEVMIPNLPQSATLSVSYFGDTLYMATAQQLRVVETRKRSVRH